MRVCPECRKEYDADVEACPDDGMALVDAPDRLPANPALRDVVPVSPTDHTAMIDLEAIEAERERRGLTRPTESAVGTAEGDAEASAAAEVDEEERRDPDATGTFHVDDLKRQERTQESAAGSLMADPDDDDDDDEDEHRPVERTERTEVTRRPRFDDVTAGRPRERGEASAAEGARPKAPVVLIAAVAAVVVVTLGLAAGVWWYVSTRGAVLTVTSVPPGATVLLDGEEIGTAPLQDRVAIGSHVIELSLAGFRPFKEVVDVPPEGLPFLQPLEEDPSAARAATTTDAGPGGEDDLAATKSAAADTAGDAGPPPAVAADDLVARFDELLAAAEYDAALEAIKELVKHHPDDERADPLFERLAEARVKAATTSKAPRQQKKRPLTAEQKKREAREAYAAGEALYREGGYAEARARFQAAIQLDPRYPQPHRAIARIYQRDDDVAKARYHLDRYLRLGGRDPDYRVRRWLEDNKGN